MQSATFRDDIQGLRAVAVLSVVLYHANDRLLPGGFVGVDIFFVISGFLITSILLRELKDGRFSIAGFYQRRIRRLFPALFLMLVVVLAAGFFLLPPREFAELGRTTITTVFFVSNFDFYRLSGYFDGEADDKPLLHTWSLAVEEQFYIFFPLVLAFVWKRWPRLLTPLVIVGVVGALGVSAWGAFDHPTAAFYLAPFRAFELLMGVTVALMAAPEKLGQRGRDALSCAGLALIAASLWLLEPDVAFPGFAAFVPCLGAALIIYAGLGGSSIGGRVLSVPLMVFFGAISYSLYLWHWPFLSLSRHALLGTPNAWQTVLLLSAATLFAYLSWRFVEQPVLARSLSQRSIFALGGGAMACVTAVAGAVVLAHGLPERFTPRAREMFAASEDYNRRRWQCHRDEDRPIPYSDNCVFGADGVEPIAAVWSDSEGAELSVALGEALARRGQSVMEITTSACAPAQGYHLPDYPTCPLTNRDTLAHLVSDERIRTVILAANFLRYPHSDRQRLLAGYERSVDALLEADKTVVLVYPFPNFEFEPPRVLGLLANRGRPLDTVGMPLTTHESDNGDVIAFLDRLSQHPDVEVFHPTQSLCVRGFCHAYLPEAGVLYFNVNHISVTGARWIVRDFPFASIPAAPEQRHGPFVQ